MKKTLSLPTTLILSLHCSILSFSSGWSVTLDVIGPCHEEPLFSTTVALSPSSQASVGSFSVDTFDRFAVSYIGTKEGIHSIFDTPTGRGAMEILSSTEYLAYGWCFKVNDIAPDVYPHEILLKNDDHIVWWFGYAHFKNGQWITQCEPSFMRKSPQFCD